MAEDGTNAEHGEPEHKPENAGVTRRHLVRALAIGGTAAAATALVRSEAGAQARPTPTPTPTPTPGASSIVFRSTISDLKSYNQGAKIAVVEGYHSEGDGGGGVFVLDPDSGEPFDDGIVIQPHPSLSGKWLRVFEPPIDVKWFGARGTFQSNPSNSNDPAFDDAIPIQKAIDYANLRRQAVAGAPEVLGSGLETMWSVYVPRGKYRINSTIYLGIYQRIFGDGASTLVATRDDVDILGVNPRFNTIEGLGFAGGRHHIVLFPVRNGQHQFAPTASGSFHVLNCLFRYPHGPAIYQDFSGDATQFHRNAVGHLLVEGCVFEGGSFYWSNWDHAIIRMSQFNMDQVTVPVEDDQGRLLALFNTTGKLNVEDMEGTPNADLLDTAWFQGGGIATFERARFGGESRVHGFKLRTDAKLNGLALPAELGLQPHSVVRILDCDLASFAARNIVEVWEKFPALLEIRSPSPLRVATSESYGVSTGNGIWVSNDVDIPAMVSEGIATIQLALQGLPDAFKIRQSGDHHSTDGVDLWPQLRHFIMAEPWPRANALYPHGELRRNNLWFAGDFDLGNADVPGEGVAVGLGRDGFDQSTGYDLTVFVAGQDNARLTTTIRPQGVSTRWGQGMPAGEYTFSCFVKTSWPARVELSRASTGATRGEAIRYVGPSANYSRVWFSFFHDGSARDFHIQVAGIPNGGRFSVGLFSVNRGPTPASYTFPVNDRSAPTANITNENLIRSSYVAASPPPGAYRRGDIVWNSSPARGEPIGWVCVAAPADFAAFGLIES